MAELQQDIPAQRNWLLPEDLARKFRTTWAEFETEHPEFLVEDRKMPAKELADLFRRRNAAWSAKLGIEKPLVPSLVDHYREAGCLRCLDGGWVQLYHQKKNGERKYTDLIRCPDCGGEDRESRMLAYAGIPDAQRLATFESFKVLKGTKPAYDAAKSLVSGAQFFMLLLYGTYGNGKTHLAYAACREAVKTMRAKFVYVPAFMGKLRGMIDSGGDLQGAIQELKDIAFLALDDFGAELGTHWQQSTLEEIINHRYANCGYTIVTTNKDITTLPGPLLSRFQDQQFSRMVLNEAPDYRPRKRRT